MWLDWAMQCKRNQEKHWIKVLSYHSIKSDLISFRPHNLCYFSLNFKNNFVQILTLSDSHCGHLNPHGGRWMRWIDPTKSSKTKSCQWALRLGFVCSLRPSQSKKMTTRRNHVQTGSVLSTDRSHKFFFFSFDTKVDVLNKWWLGSLVIDTL